MLCMRVALRNLAGVDHQLQRLVGRNVQRFAAVRRRFDIRARRKRNAHAIQTARRGTFYIFSGFGLF
jgi:hypothetical protein